MGLVGEHGSTLPLKRQLRSGAYGARGSRCPLIDTHTVIN